MSSPYINRFIQPDTVIPDLSNPQSWNRFTYGLNNPLHYIDPSGHDPITALILIAAAITFLVSACSATPSSEPLTPRQSEIQNLIDKQDYQGAIDKAIALYDIDTHGIQPTFGHPVNDSDIAETRPSGGNYVNGVYVGGTVETVVGPKAFKSPEDLVDTLVHESVHVEQFKNGRWYQSSDGFNMNEVEAYDRVISRKDEFELSDSIIKQDKRDRNSYYDQLPASLKKRINNGIYSLPE